MAEQPDKNSPNGTESTQDSTPESGLQPGEASQAEINLQPAQNEMPFAIVEGQPYTQLPQDLYIPPDALEVFLEAFEGPLDLLLYLIKRQNLDVLNINVSQITQQYMEYIELMQSMQWELAAEYLVMAAMLAEIKSRSLLPRHTDDEEDEGDPRTELIRRLQEYERYKQAAEDLDELPRLERDLHVASAEPPDFEHSKPLPDVTLRELLLALAQVLARADLFQEHEVEREKLSTREKMSFILNRLQGRQFVPFISLFTPEEGRQGVIVTFLAMMELIKESLVDIVQNEVFGPIHLKARVNE
jgi:segregation and condensation protein A